MSKKLYSNNGRFQNHEKKHRKPRRKLGWVKISLLTLCTVLVLSLLGVGGFLLHNQNAESNFQKMAEQTRIAATTPATAASMEATGSP